MKSIVATIFFFGIVFLIGVGKVFGANATWSDVSGGNTKNGLISQKKGAETNISVSENGRVFSAYEDKAKKNRARVRMFDGTNWQDLADTQNQNGWVSMKKGGNPTLETDGDEVYVAFTDYSDSKSRAKIKKWSGGSWRDLADAQNPDGYISTLRGFEPALSFDKSKNYLYAAFRDEANGEREKVMRWSESSGWQSVADTENPEGLVSSSVASEIDIESSKLDDSMFVAFEDRTKGNKIIVKKWDGVMWQALTDDSHLEGVVSSVAGYSPSIDTDNLGNLYLVYTGKNQKNTYFHRWDGSHWADVSGGAAVRGKTIESTISIDGRNYLYLAYSQKIKGAWKVRVKVWDGLQWFDARDGNNNNISKGKGKGDPSLATYGNKLFMSFTDARNKNRARVKMLNFE
jgi:hypothetical protein